MDALTALDAHKTAFHCGSATCPAHARTLGRSRGHPGGKALVAFSKASTSESVGKDPMGLNSVVKKSDPDSTPAGESATPMAASIYKLWSDLKAVQANLP